jgi:hypothetical protein
MPVAFPSHNEPICARLTGAGRSSGISTYPCAYLGLGSQDEVESINTLKYLGQTGVIRASHSHQERFVEVSPEFIDDGDWR